MQNIFRYANIEPCFSSEQKFTREKIFFPPTG